MSDFIFLGFKITADSECSHDIKRCLLLGRKDVTNLDSNIKKQRHHFADKGPYSQRHGFPVVMYRCESWTIRLSAEGLILSNCGVGEDSWEYHGLQGVKLVSPKGNQSWIFIGRTDAEAEVPIFWPPDAKSQLIGKDPEAGKDRGQEENRAKKDEMVGWTLSKLGEMVKDRGAWHAAVHGIAMRQMWLSD